MALLFNSRYLASYRFFRSQGVSAQQASYMAAREQRLKRVIEEGKIRVRWEDDTDFDPTGYHDEALVRRRVESGRYEVKGLIIERYRQCPTCGTEEWEVVDSCWGIVLDARDVKSENDYQRYMETEVYCG